MNRVQDAIKTLINIFLDHKLICTNYLTNAVVSFEEVFNEESINQIQSLRLSSSFYGGLDLQINYNNMYGIQHETAENDNALEIIQFLLNVIFEHMTSCRELILHGDIYCHKKLVLPHYKTNVINFMDEYLLIELNSEFLQNCQELICPPEYFCQLIEKGNSLANLQRYTVSGAHLYWHQLLLIVETHWPTLQSINSNFLEFTTQLEQQEFATIVANFGLDIQEYYLDGVRFLQRKFLPLFLSTYTPLYKRGT